MSLLLAFAACGVTFTVYLGMYALNNPDPADVWVVEKSGLALQIGQQGDEAATPVHDRFTMWFLWGFIQCIVFVGGTCLHNVIKMIKRSLDRYGDGRKVAKGTGKVWEGLMGCAFTLGALSWWITGAVFRFNRAG